jgi:hypothetical protein
MDPRSIGVRCGSTAILPLVGKAGVQSSAGGISPACPARSLPCAWCMHGRAFRSSLSSPCRSSSVLSVVVLLRGTPRFFGGFRDRGLRASLFIGRLVGISCCCLGRGATGVAVIVAPFIPRPPRTVHRSFWVCRVGSSLCLSLCLACFNIIGLPGPKGSQAPGSLFFTAGGHTRVNGQRSWRGGIHRGGVLSPRARPSEAARGDMSWAVTRCVKVANRRQARVAFAIDWVTCGWSHLERESGQCTVRPR